MNENRKEARSDTVSVTPDGRILVDTSRLFQKKHIREMVKNMRSKTITVPRKTEDKKAQR